MPTDTVEQTPDLPFQVMTQRIVHNAGADFGGAFVVVPPAEGGEVLNTLLLDSRQDPVQFWILLKTKCETEIANLDQKQRGANAFGRR
jgi:hypothetical protein